MMLRAALCALALASAASANATANYFIDQIFHEMRDHVLQNGLDSVHVTPFQFTVKSNSFSNRDLKANFTQGSMTGFGSLVRQGDCTYEGTEEQMKMDCYVSLGPLQITMNAEVKGDSYFGGKHAIETSTAVTPTTLARIELMGNPLALPIMESITVETVTMTTTVVKGKLDLNGSRMTDFMKQTNQNLSNQLVATLSSSYGAALDAVLSHRTMP